MVHLVLVCWSSALCVSSNRELLNCFVYKCNLDVVRLLICSPRLHQATGHTFCLLIKLYLDTYRYFDFKLAPCASREGPCVLCHFLCEDWSKANTPSQETLRSNPHARGGDVITDRNTLTLRCILIPMWSSRVCFFVFTLCKLSVCFATKCF